MEIYQSLSGFILITKSNKGFVHTPAENQIDIQKTIFIYPGSDPVDMNTEPKSFSEFKSIIFVNYNFWEAEDLETFVKLKAQNPKCRFYLKIDQNYENQFNPIYGLDLGLDGILVAGPIFAEEAFQQRLDKKIKHNSSFKADSGSLTMDQIREEMEIIDSHIIQLIGRRMELSEDMAALKYGIQQPFLQCDRWDTVLHKAIVNGAANGIPENLIKDIFNTIHIGSIKAQLDWLGKMEKNQN